MKPDPILTYAAKTREQLQNARDNPIAAAAAAAGATSGGASQNAENLLDIDFDGAAPASSQNNPGSGLEGLAGTPQRTVSPPVASSGNKNLDDLMGVFGGSGGTTDIMNGFGGLDLGGPASQPPPQQQQKKANEDILGLF